MNKCENCGQEFVISDFALSGYDFLYCSDACKLIAIKQDDENELIKTRFEILDL